jgi:aminoglycoside phosphotransferase (APT) family kinase protein
MSASAAGDALADTALLSELFTRHLGTATTVAAVKRSALGNGQETWFVDTSAGPFVVRRSAIGGPLTWTSRATEFAALDELRSSGLPVPRVLWHEPDGGSLERAYLVMERLPGKPPGRSFDEAMARDLGRMLGRLHAATRDASATIDASQLRDHLATTVRRYSESLFSDEPLAAALLGWLDINVPARTTATVRLWGDPGPHNMLVDGGTITALLDWEMTSRGHPGEDLGAARWSVLGFADPLAIDTGYADVTDAIPADEGAWFEVLAHLVRAGQALDGTLAFLRGDTDETTLPAMGLGLVTANLLRAAHRAWGTPLATDPGGIGAPQRRSESMLGRIDSVIAHLTADERRHDARSAARLRIAEVVRAAYAAGADVRDDATLARFATTSLGVTVNDHAELLDVVRRHAARIADDSAVRDVLLSDVAARRSRMTDLLGHFGQTTSTSVAR